MKKEERIIILLFRVVAELGINLQQYKESDLVRAYKFPNSKQQAVFSVNILDHSYWVIQKAVSINFLG